MVKLYPKSLGQVRNKIAFKPKWREKTKYFGIKPWTSMEYPVNLELTMRLNFNIYIYCSLIRIHNEDKLTYNVSDE